MLPDSPARETSILGMKRNLFALSDCIDVILERHLEEVEV